MADPKIAAKQPTAVTLEAGKTYYWCACGGSKTQPFCDGAHKGTGLSPKAFTADKAGEAWLCQCKHTGNAPFCDGAHKKL
jgi:CDGSH-type Zn-finger protein